tara:strand:+ start:269 stop:760 length:492 start_codon:yes stop_codon:yes gene_type:complete
MKKLISIVLFFIIACSNKDEFVPSTNLEVNLISNSNVLYGQDLVLQIEVKNADSLFALSLELNYSSGIFEAISPAVVNGNLFSDGFKHEILSSGEVGVALGVGDNGIINSTSSGIACQISLSTIGLGNDLIYLSSIHMIKSNGDEIYGFDDLVIEPIQVNVIQ